MIPPIPLDRISCSGSSLSDLVENKPPMRRMPTRLTNLMLFLGSDERGRFFVPA
jgi:hypothetical protein